MSRTTHQYTISDFLQARAATGPSFSASGHRLAYLANLDGTFQVNVVDLRSGDQRQVTTYADPVSQIAFSPTDEEVLIFRRDVGGNECHQLSLLDVGTGRVTALTSDAGAMHRFGGWSPDGTQIAFCSYKRNGVDHDVYVLDIRSLAERMVFSPGGWTECFGYSPSGRHLVVSATKSGGYMDTELFLVAVEPVAPFARLTPHEDKAQYFGAEWLPDESGFWTMTDDGCDLVEARFVALPDTEPREPLRRDGNLEELRVCKDGRWLAAIVNTAGFSTLILTDLLGGVVGEYRVDGVAEAARWSPDGRRLAFAAGDFASASDVSVWEIGEPKPRRITSLPRPVPPDAMCRPELVSYRSFDGLEIPAFVYRPKCAGGEPAPAVVYIHGGPEGQFRPSYNPVVQYLSHRRYVVIAPNVRGSDGYGKRYLALDDRFKRLDSVRDLEGVYRWIERDGGIDPRRVALMGGSYGGYMVLAGLAFQPDLWAAGVDIVGIASLVTFLENTSAYRRSAREAEYGYLATDREFLESASPLSRMADMRAPLFIIHGANDPRVPLSEATAMHAGLKSRGIHAELLVYDDEGHGLGKLKNRLDAYSQAADFLDRELGLTRAQSAKE